MKNVLFEYYKPGDEELKIAWDTGIFTFDANVLLNLYRYSQKTGAELFSILNFLKPKIWLSHQAGYEFFKNRLLVMHSQKSAYDEIKALLDKKAEEISSELLSYKKHSVLIVEQIKSNIDKAFADVIKELEKAKSSHPDYEKEDSIRDRVTKLFDKKVGDPFSEKELLDIYKEGETRYNSEVPPGYKDKSRKKDSPKQNLYGDLILWKQVISRSKAEKKPVILVTDDLKEDWWEKFHGTTQGPRKELLREFFSETGLKIYIYQADKFLEYANKLKIGKQVKQKTIEEVRDIRIKDEGRERRLTDLAKFKVNRNAYLSWMNEIPYGNPMLEAKYRSVADFQTKLLEIERKRSFIKEYIDKIGDIPQFDISLSQTTAADTPKSNNDDSKAPDPSLDEKT